MILFNENLVPRAKSALYDSAGKDCELFWSTGVLEYWSVGKSKSYNSNLKGSFHYSITPQLHHSSRLLHGGKSMEEPSGGSPMAGSLGPDSLLGKEDRA